MTDKLTEDQQGAILKQIPTGRMGTPEEIAAATCFLASPDAGYITGTVLAREWWHGDDLTGVRRKHGHIFGGQQQA